MSSVHAANTSRDFSEAGVDPAHLKVDIDALATERSATLLKTLKDPSANMDDRFDAALALRRQEKKLPAMKILLSWVDASTKLPAVEGANVDPAIHDQEKLGKMSAIALQGQVSESPELMEQVASWVKEGIALHRTERNEASQLAMREAQRAGSSKLWLPASAREQDDSPQISRQEETRRGEVGDKFARSMLILGSPRTDQARALLCDVLMERAVGDSIKTFALHGLAGLEHDQAAVTFALILQDRQTSDFLFQRVFSVLEGYCPQNDALRNMLGAMGEAAQAAETRTNIELDLRGNREVRSIEAQIQKILSNPCTDDVAERVQHNYSAEVWRTLMHLHHPHSQLSIAGSNTLMETRPEGSKGDVVFSKRIRANSHS